LEQNFLALNRNFSKVFARIVPEGKAELKLVKEDSQNATS